MSETLVGALSFMIGFVLGTAACAFWEGSAEDEDEVEDDNYI